MPTLCVLGCGHRNVAVLKGAALLFVVGNVADQGHHGAPSFDQVLPGDGGNFSSSF